MAKRRVDILVVKDFAKVSHISNPAFSALFNAN